MGGIFGATALDDVVSSVMRGLADLDRPGYDSVGLGVLVDRQIRRRRVSGPLASLEELLATEPAQAGTVIGHARWATHGEPSRHNAHPHASSRVAVVHNGIIDNCRELRDSLQRDGVQFRSETDTEVIVWMLDQELAAGAHPLLALRNVLPRLQGSFAIGVLCAQHEQQLFGARRGRPLYAALAGGTAWLSSDAAALARVAPESVHFEDGQIAALTPGKVRLFDMELRPLTTKWVQSPTEAPTGKSGEHTIFSRHELATQAALLETTLHELGRDMKSGKLERWCGPLWRADRILAVGSGSAFYAAYAARAWLEQIAGVPVELELASELRTRRPILAKGTTALVVSGSDDTDEPLAALRYLRTRDVPTVALVDEPDGAVGREADAIIDCAGEGEAGMGITRGFSDPLRLLAAASLAIRRLRQGGTEAHGMSAAILALPEAIRSALGLEDQCARLGRRLVDAGHAVYLGSGASYPLALEAALKLTALSPVRAEGFAAGELSHGLDAIIQRGTPVVVVAPHDATFERTLAQVREVIARGGEPVLVGDAHTAARAKADELPCIAAGQVDPVWSPLVLSVPLQLITYHAAVAGQMVVDRLANIQTA